MNAASKVALLFMPDGSRQQRLAERLVAAGYAVERSTPGNLPDEAAWRTRVAAMPSVNLLVHEVSPPTTTVTETCSLSFERAFEDVVGSLWIGGTVCGAAMRAQDGGVIVVFIPAAADASVAAIFGDGLRSLASCLGVGYAACQPPVRVISVSPSWSDLSDLAVAELIAFLASSASSYFTATSVTIQ